LCLPILAAFLLSCGNEYSGESEVDGTGQGMAAMLQSFGSCETVATNLAGKLSAIISSEAEGARAVKLEQDYLDAYLKLYQCDSQSAGKWEREVRAKTLNSGEKTLKYINFLKSIQGAVFILKGDTQSDEETFQTHVRYINDIYDSVEDAFKDLLAVKDDVVGSKFEDGFDNDTLVYSLVFNATSGYWNSVFSLMTNFKEHSSLSDETVWEAMWAAYLFLDNETLAMHIPVDGGALQRELTFNLRVNLVHNAVEYFNVAGGTALANAKAVYATDISNVSRILTLTHRSGKALYDRIVQDYEGLCLMQEVHTGGFGAGRESLYLGLKDDPIYIRPYQEGDKHNLEPLNEKLVQLSYPPRQGSFKDSYLSRELVGQKDIIKLLKDNDSIIGTEPEEFRNWFAGLNTGFDIYEALTDVGFNRLSKCFPEKVAAFANDNLSHRVLIDLDDVQGEPTLMPTEAYEKRYRELDDQIGADTSRYVAGSIVKQAGGCTVWTYVEYDGFSIKGSNYLCSDYPINVMNYREIYKQAEMPDGNVFGLIKTESYISWSPGPIGILRYDVVPAINRKIYGITKNVFSHARQNSTLMNGSYYEYVDSELRMGKYFSEQGEEVYYGVSALSDNADYGIGESADAITGWFYILNPKEDMSYKVMFPSRNGGIYMEGLEVGLPFMFAERSDMVKPDYFTEYPEPKPDMDEELGSYSGGGNGGNGNSGGNNSGGDNPGGNPNGDGNGGSGGGNSDGGNSDSGNSGGGNSGGGNSDGGNSGGNSGGGNSDGGSSGGGNSGGEGNSGGGNSGGGNPGGNPGGGNPSGGGNSGGNGNSGGGDYLGGLKDDYYSFNLGDEDGVIHDSGGVDTIVFGEGITPEMVYVQIIEDRVVFLIRNADMSVDEYLMMITVESGHIENIRFSDGSTLGFGGPNLSGGGGFGGGDSGGGGTGDPGSGGGGGTGGGIGGGNSGTITIYQIIWIDAAITAIGTDLNDVITTASNNDILIGGKGSDFLYGGDGDDIYIFNRGDGHDLISDTGGSDRILFGEGITKDDLYAVFEFESNNSYYLVVTIREEGKSFAESTDKIHISNFKLSNKFGIGRIENAEFSDGTEIAFEEIISFVGTEGNDEINWGGGVVNVNAGDGNDRISSGDYDDILAGGKGNDYLSGGGGNDTYIFNRGDGRDIVYDISGEDKIVFGEGITKDDLYAKFDGNYNIIIGIKEDGKTFSELSDWITMEGFRSFYSLNNGQIEKFVFSDGTELTLVGIISLLGTEGNDVISWRESAVNINTGNGNDTVESGDYDDTLAGGKGNDILSGGGGNDTYIFNRGDGQDIIYDTSGDDKITFGEGITKDDLYAVFKYDPPYSDYSLIIAIKEEGKSFAELADMIQISKFRQAAGVGSGRIESIEFSDGTVITLDGIIALLGTEGDDEINWNAGVVNVNAGDGNDKISSGDYDDILAGGKGNDILSGGGGNDTYIFNRGDGQDIIYDTSGDDKIIFGEGITKDDLYAVFDGNYNIIIGIKEEGKTFSELSDKITIANFRLSSSLSYGQIEKFIFSDGTESTLEWIAFLGTEGDDTINWPVNVMNANAGDGNDRIYSGDYDDTLAGGKGNDYLSGGNGNDTYIFNRGDGRDTINDIGGDDKIIFGEGITKDNLYVVFSGLYDIIIGLKEEGKAFSELSDSIKIEGFRQNSALNIGQIEKFVFSDGTEATLDEIAFTGTEGDDTIDWAVSILNVNGEDGNDKIYSGDYDDILAGGKGNDYLSGGGGNDTYIFNRGDGQDIIYDISGDDKIIFGEGITKEDLYAAFKGTYDIIIGIREEGKTFSELSDFITIYGFRQGSSLHIGQIEKFVFSDGSELTLDGIIGLFGTEGDDSVTWHASVVNVNMGAGNDTLESGDFDDTLVGGKGNDTLRGGAGDDTYIFNIGDGQDIISDSSGTDRLVFTDASGNGFGFLTVSGKLNISYGDGDNIRVDGGVIERYELSDGGYLTAEDVTDILSRITATGIKFNSADEVRQNEELSLMISDKWHYETGIGGDE
jgi:Ca2+-binding RTX toxin-like protein